MKHSVVPLLRNWSVEVVAYGPSHHDDDSFYLIRSYANSNDRHESQNSFYNSLDWIDGPRDNVMALLETYSTFTLYMPDYMIDSLSKNGIEKINIEAPLKLAINDVDLPEGGSHVRDTTKL